MNANLFSVNNIVSLNPKGDVVFNNYIRDDLVSANLRILYINSSPIVL